MEFVEGGKTYRAGRLDAVTQFHVVRRLAPVLGELAPAMKAGGDGLEALPPLASAVAKMTDEDANYCLFGLLGCVTRKQDNGLGWGPVSVGNSLMYADIDMGVMLKLAWQAALENLGSFFASLPSASSAASPNPSGPSAG
jgi:hypothetical protein